MSDETITAHEHEHGGDASVETRNSDFDDVLGSMPDPTEGVAEREQAKMTEQQEKTAGLVDREGREFDPSIHRTDENGDPKLTKSGKLAMKPGKSSKAGQSKLNTGGESKEEKQAREARDKSRAAGTMAANIAISSMVTVGGDDFMPRSEQQCGYDERNMLQQAYADYFEASGYTDFPPGIALTAVMFAYVSPRLNMPKTRKRLFGFFDWVKNFRKKRKKGNRKRDSEDKGGWLGKKSSKPGQGAERMDH